jgi:nitrate/TMAO reductase-like tetraheme cytochrome c subunit
MFFLFFVVQNSFAQLSPGDLSSSHAHLEGLRNCTKCHVLGEKETTSKCLACHTEIQQLLDQNRGYHSSSEAKGKKCAECHGDHHGRDFEMTRFDAIGFNHDLTGYTLEGRHSQLQCADCHKSELIKTRVSQKDGYSYLGLGTECLSCHDDYHQNTKSNDCLSCHDQNTFKLAVDDFDHAQTRFPLTGRHQSLACESCHTGGDVKSFQQYTNTQLRQCNGCHEDVHNNEYGSNCSQCHTVYSFTRIKTTTAFNHDKTNFPLTGMHTGVGCKECHAGSYNRPVPHQSCTDCHSDFHEGQLAKNGVSPDCSQCHSVEGFSPAKFSIENHNLTNFPLEGAHLATPCVFCHRSAGKWDFSKDGSNCVNCHPNIHENILAERFMQGNSCESCHAVSSWDEIEFNHSLTNFELVGKHTQASCRDCHFSEQENGTVVQKFSGLASSCENCHTDIHFKQFEVDNRNDCARCHTSENWNPEKFNHNNTRFKLDGEHVGLNCSSCHKRTEYLIPNYTIYKIEDISCASCH